MEPLRNNPKSLAILNCRQSRATALHLYQNDLKCIAPFQTGDWSSVILSDSKKVDNAPRFASCFPAECY